MVKFVLLEWSLSPNFFVPRYSFLFFLKKQSQCWDELKWFWIKLLVLLSLSKNQDRFFSLSFSVKIQSPFNNLAFNPRAHFVYQKIRTGFLVWVFCSKYCHHSITSHLIPGHIWILGTRVPVFKLNLCHKDIHPNIVSSIHRVF